MFIATPQIEFCAPFRSAMSLSINSKLEAYSASRYRTPKGVRQHPAPEIYKDRTPVEVQA